MKWQFVFLLICLNSVCYCQKNDFIWIIGGNSVNHFNDGYQWGTAVADFAEDPVLFRYDEKITMDLSGANAIVSDELGDLRMYSNGMYVQNQRHQDVSGLDTISYSPHWENFNYHGYLPDGSDWKSGLSGNQWVLMLPDPSNKDAYYIYHPYVEITKGPSYIAHLFETKVVFDAEKTEGKVIYKEKKINSGEFQWGMTAVRHANGRDWWLVHSSLFNKTMEIYLLSEHGLIHHHSENIIFSSKHRRSYQQASFSPRGDKLVLAEGLELTDTIRISIYDFDRCSGQLSKNENKLITNRNFLYGVASFSPDGKYLYYSGGLKMFQCDMDVADIFSSEMIVAEYDGSISALYNEKLTFSKMATGPDGRIYCIPPGNTRSIHTIEYPEERGILSTVIQNKITLPVQNFNSIPNFPNYRLGPVDGSLCDTLDIDNIPAAHFRFEQDTSNYLQLRFTDLSYFRPESWEWNFGDGTTFSGRKPYFHTFPKPGKYQVCLSVSNENGDHTYCRDVVIGDSSTAADGKKAVVSVHLFPNPTDGNVNLTISDYVPSHAKVLMYDILGTLVLEKRVYYGHNHLELSHLQKGIYLFNIIEGGKHVFTGKVVKID